MNPQDLQHYLEEIRSYIDSFNGTLADSESDYQTSLKLVTDPTLRSLLMEQHTTHIERQKAALAKMEMLYSEVRNHLTSLGESNL